MFEYYLALNLQMKSTAALQPGMRNILQIIQKCLKDATSMLVLPIYLCNESIHGPCQDTLLISVIRKNHLRGKDKHSGRRNEPIVVI